MTEDIIRLITATEDYKQTHYIELDRSNESKNRIVIKNALQDLEIDNTSLLEINAILANPHSTPTLALFAQNNELVNVIGHKFPFAIHTTYKRYFILPLFDSRYQLLSNHYLLVFSKQNLSMYKVHYDQLEKIEIEDADTYESFISIRYENESVQHHIAEHTVFHGQNAATEKDREHSIIRDYIGKIADRIARLIQKQDCKLSIFAPKGTLELLENYFAEYDVLFLKKEGNYDETSISQLSEMLLKLLEEKQRESVEQLVSHMDITESNRLESESFLNILAVVNSGRIDTMYIGKLGIHDHDYTNPIAPLGANYIAQEVLKLGGSVSFFPDIPFPFSKSNIAYKFRY